MSKQGKAAALLLLIVLAAVALWQRSRSADPVSPVASAQPSALPSVSRRVRFGGRHQSVSPTGAESVAVGDQELGALDGRVLSLADGRGVPGAQVGFSGGSLHTVVTDADGRFRFQPTREGTYELALVTASGFLSFAPELGHSPLLFVARRGVGLRGAEIHLTPSVAYTAVVVNGDDEPIAGATLRRLGAAEDLPIAPTDANGETTFTAPDDTIVEARHDGFEPARARVDTSAQITRRVVLRLSVGDSAIVSSATIRGTVVGSDGEPVLDALLTARFDPDNAASPGADLVPGGTAVSDDNGAFSIDGLDRGRKYVVAASAGGWAPSVVRGIAAPATLAFELRTGVGLFGDVRDAATGEPIPAFVVMVAEARGELEMDVVTLEPTFDASGSYTIPALPEGRYRVSVSAANYATSPWADVVLRQTDERIDFELSPGGTISGTVVDARSGDPIAGAKVSLESHLPGDAGTLPLRHGSVTDGAGAFVLRGVGPSLSSIFVAASGHHARVLGGLMVSEGQRLAVKVELSPLQEGETPTVELVGIGAMLSSKQDVLLIGGVVDGGGAAEVGLGEGDAILAVDDIPVGELGFGGAVQRIRGPEGSTVRLLIRKSGAAEALEIAVPRRRVRAP